MTAAAPPRVTVVDTGAGNLRSVVKALERSGLCARVSGDPEALEQSDAVLLPGVGAFADAARALRARGLDEALRESIASGRPYLGLCLGLQLLFEDSDEHGQNEGLGILKGRVQRFPARLPNGESLRVPHIGWNEVRFEGDHPMLARLAQRDIFYFVHGYRAVPADDKAVVGRCDYGGSFAAAVAQGNVFAVQFHPEKSQRAGKQLLDAFAAWLGAAA